MDQAAIEATLKALDLVRDSQTASLHFWTVIVVIGVCLEVPALVFEHFHEWKDFRRGTIHSPEKPLVILFLVGCSGTALVAIGVAEELRYQKMIEGTDFSARHSNEQLVGLLNQEAEKERTERSKLIQKMQWRTFPANAAEAICSKFSSRELRGMTVESYPGNLESWEFSRAMVAAFRSGREPCRGLETFGPSLVQGYEQPVRFGTWIFFDPRSSEARGQANVLKRALSSNGVPIEGILPRVGASLPGTVFIGPQYPPPAILPDK